MEYIPMDRQLFKDCHVVFSQHKRLVRRCDAGVERGACGRAFRVFRTPGFGGVEFRFEICEHARWDEQAPVLGRRGYEILIGMIYFAKPSGSLNGLFRLKDMARFLKPEPPESGRFYQDIRRTLMSLLTVHARLDKGERVKEISFLKSWTYDRGTRVYKYTLNRDALGVTAMWLEDELTQDNMGSGYIRYPLSYIKGSITESEKAFRDYLLLLHRPVTVKVLTMARQWCGLSEDALKRKSVVHRKVYGFLRNAQQRGDIASWKSSSFKPRTWKSEWKITITKPRRPRGKDHGMPRTLSVEEQAFIDDLVEWMHRPIHRLRWTEAELRDRARNTVLAYGLEPIRNLYTEHGLGAYPNVHKFWQGVSALKARKHGTAQERDLADVAT